jgi:uncharacterized caspase-like protein
MVFVTQVHGLLARVGAGARGALPGFAFWAAASWALAAAPPYRAALIIGNSHYTSVGTLKNPSNDAQDMCGALGALGYQTKCFLDVDTRVRLRSVIEDFIESVPENAVTVIYYAGHAVQVNGENYLVPTSARLNDEAALVREAVSISFLMNQLRRASGYLTVVILDACRDNPLAAANQGLPQGLAQITDIPDGTEILYATAANQPALDGVGRNGILTKHLLAHLHDPGTIDDVFKQTSLGVQSEAQALGHTQIPALYTNFTGQYCMVRCTDLEVLESQRREAQQRIADLEARVAAGDQGALTELAAARTNNERLLEQIRKKDEQARAAEQAAKDRQKKSFVPPAF